MNKNTDTIPYMIDWGSTTRMSIENKKPVFVMRSLIDTDHFALLEATVYPLISSDVIHIGLRAKFYKFTTSIIYEDFKSILDLKPSFSCSLELAKPSINSRYKEDYDYDQFADAMHCLITNSTGFKNKEVEESLSCLYYDYFHRILEKDFNFRLSVLKFFEENPHQDNVRALKQAWR